LVAQKTGAKVVEFQAQTGGDIADYPELCVSIAKRLAEAMK
jgi:hypothetical protein